MTDGWIMHQVRHDLLFAHWPVRDLDVPLPLDRFDGRAWIGVVPFRMSGVRPRGLPATPFMSEFPEINLRTYVTLDDRPGVYFFSLDVSNALAVMVARRFYRLPYFRARVESTRVGDGIDFRMRRDAPPAEFAARYHPIGPPFEAESGTLEHFLTERYSLYTADRRGRVYRADIEHPPWPLQAAAAEIEVNTLHRGAGEPLLHFARRLDVKVWPLRRVR